MIWSRRIAEHITLKVLSYGDITYVLSCLENGVECGESSLGRFIKWNKNPSPLRSILSIIKNHYHGFGIIERPYLDLEFWDSYSGFYSQSFSQYDIECIRVHFFNSRKADADPEVLKTILEKGGSESDVAQAEFDWLGCTVLRPMHSNTIGRTAIKFDTNPIDSMPSTVNIFDEERGGKPYLKSKQMCHANLLNAHFSVKTPEFIQQDSNIGQCATASLWVATNIMAECFKTYKLNYRTIADTPHLRSNNGLADPNSGDIVLTEDGLSSHEIKNVINSTGARCISITRRNSETIMDSYVRISNDVYSFVESGYPVLLCIAKRNSDRGHVIAAVGHCLPSIQSLDVPDASSLFDEMTLLPIEMLFFERNYLVGNIVNVYYCHDDAYGPFNKIVLSKPEISKNKNHNNGIKVLVGRDKKEHILHEVLIPVPKIVKCTASSAVRDAIRTFVNFATIAGDMKERIIMWRSLLVLGSTFKRSVIHRKYQHNERTWYSQLHLPKYVWLIEFSAVKRAESNTLFYNRGFDARYISGEFLYDATIPGNPPRMISARLGPHFQDYSMMQFGRFDEWEKELYPCYQDIEY